LKKLLLAVDWKAPPGLDWIRVNAAAAVREKLLREMKLVHATARRAIELGEGEDAISARLAAGTNAIFLFV